MRTGFSLDYDVLTVERPQKIYLMARFEAGDAPGERLRRPLNLSLVIDRSSSMAGDKLDYTKQASQFLVQHLGEKDVLSIVLYNDKIETLLLPQIVANKDMITQSIDRIASRGTTNLSGGWLEGCRHVKERWQTEKLNRVILMSDGLANRGVTDSGMLVKMARQKRDEGVSTTTMGLGDDFNEELLMEMASAGGGAFYFIESPEVAPTIFHEELSGLLNVVGQNLTISIQSSEHVSTVRQLNAYPATNNKQETSFQLGDIFGNEVKTLVLEIAIPALDTIGEQQIALLNFEYDEITSSETIHHAKQVPVIVNIRSATAPSPLPNSEVMQSVLLLKAAQARQSAVKAADKGQFADASEILSHVANEIEKSKINDAQLQEEHTALLKQAEQMQRGAENYNKYSRKTMSTQAFYTMTSRHDDTMTLREREHKRSQKRKTLEQAVPAVNDGEQATPVRKPGILPKRLQWKEQIYDLNGDLIRLGRSAHNEIIINEKGVSRFHSQIRRDGEKLLLEDVGSTNGTKVNGHLIDGLHELCVGDVVYLCDAKLVFLDDAD